MSPAALRATVETRARLTQSRSNASAASRPTSLESVTVIDVVRLIPLTLGVRSTRRDKPD